jgi:hypothetical protein
MSGAAQRSGEAMRMSRVFCTKLYHVLAVAGHCAGGGVGEVVQTAFRGLGAPEYVRIELRYGDAPVEVVLDFAALVEEDVVTRREADAPETEHTWRRQGHAITMTNARGVRRVEASGNDMHRMLESFRDVVLGRAQPITTLDDALDVMRTAHRVVSALAAAGVPFERPHAPKHVASSVLKHPAQAAS